jgi:hypothetical protein
VRGKPCSCKATPYRGFRSARGYFTSVPLVRCFASRPKPKAGLRATSYGLIAPRALKGPQIGGAGQHHVALALRAAGLFDRDKPWIGADIRHVASLSWAGAQHSLSPLNAECQAVIDGTKFPFCREVDSIRGSLCEIFINFANLLAKRGSAPPLPPRQYLSLGR